MDGGVLAPPMPILAAGTAHTCAIFSPGAVRCWGDNKAGQLGRPAGGEPLAAYSVDLGSGQRAAGIFASSNTTCVILDGGGVKCWGQNSHGQLGLEDALNRGDGQSAMGDGLPTVKLGEGQRAVSLAVGDSSTCALLATGRVKCWGDAYQGALGYGDNVIRGDSPGTMGDNLPVVDLGSRNGVPLIARSIAAIQYHSFCAILNDTGPENSALKCWGSNDYCELCTGTNQSGLAGMPGTTGDNLPWVDLGTTATGAQRKAMQVAGGFQFVCVLGDDGAVKCWGDNLSGQLGLGTTSRPVSCEPDETGNSGWIDLSSRAATIAASGPSGGAGAHACALLESGEVRCWGENSFGQLGTGDVMNLTVPSMPLAFAAGFVPTNLVMGDQHSCALSSEGRIKCWGSNQSGQLGPPAVADLHAPGADLDLRGAIVRALAAGDDHTCAILDQGSLRCWGRNLEGQLGLGDAVNRGDQPGQMGDNLPVVQLGPGITTKAVAAGARHTCAVSASGDVRCWGANDFGQLGTGDNTPLLEPAGQPVALGAPALSVAAGGAFSCALLGGGAVKCWGKNDDGQLGSGDRNERLAPDRSTVSLASRATAVVAGDAHACALLEDHRVQCWGANAKGQLGVGDLEARLVPTAIDLGRAGSLAVAAHANQTCVVLASRQIQCWGDNAHGQLGLGDATDRAAPAAAPIDLGTGRSALALSVGGAFACALLDKQQVKCWGDNSVAELGTTLTGSLYGNAPGQMGDALPTAFHGGGRSVSAVVTGARHTCAILDTGDVRCWGDNGYGQLGAGDSDTHSLYAKPTATIDLGHES